MTDRTDAIADIVAVGGRTVKACFTPPPAQVRWPEAHLTEGAGRRVGFRPPRLDPAGPSRQTRVMMIYKILRQDEWAVLRREGATAGGG